MRAACPSTGRRGGDVEEVLVDPDRRHDAVGPAGIRVEQAVVDDYVAVDLADPGRAHLARELLDAGQRVRMRHQRRAGSAVGVAVIELRRGVVRLRPVRSIAQAEAEVARCDEHQVAAQHATTNAPGAIDRRPEAMARSVVVQDSSRAVELERRARREQLLGVLRDQHLPSLRVGDEQTPRRVHVSGLCLDARNDVGHARRDRCRGRRQRVDRIGRRRRQREHDAGHPDQPQHETH